MTLRVPLPQNNFITVFCLCSNSWCRWGCEHSVLWSTQCNYLLFSSKRQTPCFSATSTRELVETITCGKISSAKKALETAPVPALCWTCTHHHEHAVLHAISFQNDMETSELQSIGTCWTTPSSANLTRKTSLSPEQSLVQTTAGQTIVYWSRAWEFPSEKSFESPVNHHLPFRKKFDVSKLHDPTIHDEYEKLSMKS